MAASLPPVRQPTGLRDIGLASSTPFVVAWLGQSNAMGQDSTGDKTIDQTGAGIWITNDKNAPTALVKAAFGTAPLNFAVGGTSTDPALCYNNTVVHFANALRRSGRIAANRPIVIVPGWEPSKSIASWIDTGQAPDMWARFLVHLSVVLQQYPGALFDAVGWTQGENDSGATGPYNSRDTYAGAFARLIARLQALPQWSQDTRMLVQELGTWAGNTGGCARNDFIRTLADGTVYSFAQIIPSTGEAESTDNPGPHPDGIALVERGKKAFAAWMEGRISGLYGRPRTRHGGPVGPTMPTINLANGSNTLHPDDLRNGAFIIVNGGTLTLPNPANCCGDVLVQVSAQTNIAGTAQFIILENLQGTTSGPRALTNGYIYRMTPAPAAWYVSSEFPRVGGSLLFAGGAEQTSGAAITFGPLQIADAFYVLNANAVTLQFRFGARVGFFNKTGASTITVGTGKIVLPDGTQITTYTMQPGEVVQFATLVDTNTYVTGGNHGRLRHGATASRPIGLLATDRVEWFDDTLGKPIWWKGTGWVDAAGATV